MTSPTLTRLAPAALLAAALLLAGCGSSSGHDTGSMESSAPATPAASSPATPAGGSATPASGPHNDADVMFASMMIPHHQQAIEMSDILLGKTGVDSQVTELATTIKVAQAPEISQMSGWLAGWGADPSPGTMSGMDHGGMDGTMSQADMDALEQADGTQAQKLFLTGMIKHHQGAVTMAQTELEQGQNPDAKTLAKSIISTQNAEIGQMQKLLRG